MSEKFTPWSEEALEAKREYMANWRRNNKRRVQEHQRCYWERVAEARRAQEVKQ